MPKITRTMQLVLIIITVTVGSLLFLFLDLYQENINLKNKNDPTQTQYYENSIDKSTYQAVFLTNGQVYFGKISEIDGMYIRMNDVHYMQEGGEEKLIKLGHEVHGPKDPMFVSQNNILFWENLRKDSEVVKAITSNNL